MKTFAAEAVEMVVAIPEVAAPGTRHTAIRAIKQSTGMVRV